MKLKIKIALSIVLLSVVFALRQQGVSQTVRPGSGQFQQDVPMLLYLVDDASRVVVGSNRGHTPAEVAHLNTPEELFLRQKADLSLRNPAEFERLFPKSDAEMAEELVAAYALVNPAENFARVQRSKTPDQIRREEEMILEITNPTSLRRNLFEPNR